MTPDGATFEGATEPPGGPHAEVVALQRAGDAASGSTLYVPLEPCAHQGRTPPCTDAIVEAGVAAAGGPRRPRSARRRPRIQTLRDAGIQVDVGEGAAEVTASSPYLKHRRTSVRTSC